MADPARATMDQHLPPRRHAGTIDQPFPNHNGGQLQVDSRGLLYVVAPVWLLAGLADAVCHRVMRIEHNAGTGTAPPSLAQVCEWRVNGQPVGGCIEPFTTMRFQPIEQVRDFWAEVQEVARRFSQIPRSGDQVYGFAAGSICVALGNYHNMDREKRKIAPELYLSSFPLPFWPLCDEPGVRQVEFWNCQYTTMLAAALAAALAATGSASPCS